MKSFILIFFLLAATLVVCSGCSKSVEEEKIIHTDIKDSGSTKSLTHFLFIGRWFGKNGIYKYDMIKNKYEILWWHPRENVTLLTSKPGNFSSFFLTGGKAGMKGNFPFFEKIKIYRVNADLSGTENIYKIDSGMQISTGWNDDGNFEVVFTSIDKTDPSYINKYKKTFDLYGRLIDDEIETFHIIKDGFPELLSRRNPTVSRSGKYGIAISGDSVFFKTTEKDSLFFIATAKNKLHKISWSDDEKFLFLSTLELNNKTAKTKNPQTSDLFVYSVEHDSITASWGSSGIKNFFTFDTLIVFDDGFGRNSIINIYNFVKNKLVTQIRTKSECGLVYIPKF